MLIAAGPALGHLRPMAMQTYLFLVSPEEIAALEADPRSINRLDKPEGESAGTYFACALSYFLCGEAYPSYEESGPLAAALNGVRSVDCDTLDNGEFSVVPLEVAAEAAGALAAVDRKDLQERADAADHEELVDDEELYDLEILVADGDDVGATLVRDLEAVAELYAAAAEKGCGVVMYTT